jgi:hypothetical protein
MHVFHIRGFSSLVILLLAIVMAIAILVALPASFMMVLWNALVYEGFKGPEINVYQGFLLWGAVALMLKVIFKPEIKIQIQQGGANKKSSKPDAIVMSTDASKKAAGEEASSQDAAPATLDNQQNEG